MASVKAMMNCIGIDTNQDLSILFHFFGFIRQRVPTDPMSGVTATVSVLNQVRGVQGEHVHINIIRLRRLIGRRVRAGYGA
jgi:hypothetical protein